MAREMVDSGCKYLGIIPKDWKVNKFKYYLLRRDVKNRSDCEVLSLYREHGIVIKNSRDDNHNVTSEDTSKYRYVRINDFVVNKMKAWQGSVAISEYEGIVSPAYYVYEFSDDSYCPKYFHYLLRSAYKNEFRRLSGGIREGQWDLSTNALENILVILPPLPEQQKIAAFLDDKCAEIDSLIADIQREIDKLERLKRSVITEAVTKGLDKNAEMKDSGVIWAPVIPKSWKSLKIKYIMYETKTKADIETAEPLSVTQKYGIIKSSEATVANPSQSYEGYKAVSVDDIVFNKYKAHSGVFFSSTYNGMVTFNYSVYRCYESNVPKYYEYLFHTDGCIGEFKTKMHGVGESISPLYTKDLFAITVIQPTFADQRRIVEYLDIRCAEFDTILSEKQKQIEILQKLKKSVIYEYVTGKKEVK